MAYKGENHKNEKTCKKHHKDGVSSYIMQNTDLIFDNLAVQKGHVVIDLGCGAGDYSFHCAGLTGKTGCVYPCDKWPELKLKLEKRAVESGYTNIVPTQVDLIKDRYPFEDNFADLCMLVTVLHIPIIKKYSGYILSEAKRILKPSGTFAVINCKKKEMPFGPPIEMRLSSKETDSIFLDGGFTRKKDVVDLGDNYMSLFQYNH